MSILTSENLFLLEFMIVDIQLNGKHENGTPPGELCASFQFLDNAPVNICEGDFDEKDAKRKKNIRNGKSCLFSLTQNQMQNALDLFIVFINIYKKMQNGWEPNRCDIGEASVHLEGCFSEIVNNMENFCVDRPKVQTLKNNYDIVDKESNTVGRIDVYIRLTCLGKSVVTQFQMNLEDRSILFKNKEGTSACKYKKADDEKRSSLRQGIRYDSCKKVCSTGEGLGTAMDNSWQQYNMTNRNNDIDTNPNCPTIPCDTNRPNQPNFNNYQLGYNQMNTPCIECGSPANAPYSQPITPCIECGTLPRPPCLPGVTQAIPSEAPKDTSMPPSSDPPGNYKIIETSMGLNRLIIRMHRDDKNKPEEIGSSGDCCCVAEDFDETNGNQKQQTQQTQQQPRQQSPQQIKKTLTSNSPFTIKTAGSKQNDGMAINPPTYTKPDGTVVTEISDPERNLYVLKISKKGKRKDKNDNFDLEFCTPRVTEDHPKTQP